MATMTFRQAVRAALQEEMRRDDRVFVVGEEVAGYGGTFKATEGLLEEFGPERVIDTPLSESAIVGAAVGAALVGRRPVAELMYADFVSIAMDQLVNSAAKIHYLYGGEISAPLVVRTAYGAGTRSATHHSQSPEAWLANVPGLKIVVPTTPYDAKGLLKSAIRDPNPVVFMEHKRLYSKVGEVPEEEYLVPLGAARIAREGSDVTIVATGATVDRALGAARKLEAEGVSAEVVDPRTIVPLDEQTIVASVKKTGRAVVVHEAPVRFGIGGEITAVIVSQAFGYLDAPVQRVGAPYTPVPFSPPLEDAYMVNEDQIVDAVRRTLA